MRRKYAPDGDIRKIEKCELSITTNFNGNRNSFTTLKLVPENDISGDICLLEMVRVNRYDRIVNGDCKEVNVTDIMQHTSLSS